MSLRGKVITLTDSEHMRLRPDVMIGDVSTNAYYGLICDSHAAEMSTIDIYNPAIAHIVKELVGNAADADDSDYNERHPEIELSIIDRKIIEVTNYDYPMNISITDECAHEELPHTIPEICFLRSKTGSNFTANEGKIKVGKNGCGAKLGIMLSKFASVEAYNAKDNTHFYMKCINNGSEIHIKVYPEPKRDNDGWYVPKSDTKLTEYGNRSYTRVRIEPDFDTDYCYKLDKNLIPPLVRGEDIGHAFKGIEEISDDMRKCIYSQILGLSILNIPLIFDDFNTKNILGFEKVCHYIYGKRDMIFYDEEIKNTNIIIKICLVDIPDRNITYVNGIQADSGIHLSSVQSTIAKEIKNHTVGERILTLRDINHHMSMLIFISGPNPEFTSQTKTILSKIDGKAKLQIKCLKDVYSRISKWKSVSDLLQNIEAKEVISQLRGTKIKYDGKYSPANKIGKNAVLLLGEGDSTRSYLLAYRSTIPKGNNNYGVMVARGVPLNPVCKTDIEIVSNVIYQTLIHVLGLSFDLTYESEADMNTLKYGRLQIVADADDDGKHITALFISLFQYRWPALVTNGYVSTLRTPVIIVYKGKTIIEYYYSELDFESSIYNTKGYTPKYLKGLGSTSRAEIPMCVPISPVVHIKSTEDTDTYTDIALNADYVTDRKAHILRYVKDCEYTEDGHEHTDPDHNGIPAAFRTYDHLLKTDFVKFAKAALKRAIPDYRDTLKPVQRSIIEYFLLKFNFGNVTPHSMVIAMVAGSISSWSRYHHGDSSMKLAIMFLSQQFIGQGNLAFFNADGQNGSRQNRNSHSDPRYVGLTMKKNMGLLFPKKLYRCAPKRYVEGKVVGVEYIPSLVPYGLLNGCKGIAVGWSSDIPSYAPVTVINWLIARSNACDTKRPSIWWNEYKGTIDYVYNKRDGALEGYIARGKYTYTGGVMHVTELPPSVTRDKFLTVVDELETDKKVKIIRNDTDGNNPNDVNIRIKLCENVTDDELLLRIKNSLSNITMLDDTGAAIKYDNIEDYLEEFYKFITNIYRDNRDLEIKEIKDTIIQMSMKRKYIKLCIDNVINPGSMKTGEYEQIVLDNEITLAVADSVKDRMKTIEMYDKLAKDIEEQYILLDKIKEKDVRDIYVEDLKKFRDSLTGSELDVPRK